MALAHTCEPLICLNFRRLLQNSQSKEHIPGHSEHTYYISFSTEASSDWLLRDLTKFG